MIYNSMRRNLTFMVKFIWLCVKVCTNTVDFAREFAKTSKYDEDLEIVEKESYPCKAKGSGTPQRTEKNGQKLINLFTKSTCLSVSHWNFDE